MASQDRQLEAGPPHVNTGRRWWIVLLLFLGMVVCYIDRGNISIAAVPIMKEFNLSPAAMGSLMSAFFWTYALLQIPAGYVIDRFGIKWTYAVAFLIWSSAAAAVSLARTFNEVFALLLLLGVGEVVAAPASVGYLKRHFREEEQGLPTGIYISGAMIGPALGASLGGALLDRFGWRLLFLITGLMACVWLVPWLRLAPSPSENASKPILRQRVSIVAGKFPWKQLLVSPTTWGVTIGAFFYPYFLYFCLTWLPSYFVMVRGLTFSQMGSYMGLPLAAMAASSVIFGRTADHVVLKFGRPLVVRQAFVVAGFGFASLIVLIPVAKSAAAVLGILFFALAGVGLAGANYWALTQVISPVAIIGRVIGYQNMIAQIAGICASILTGFLVERFKSFTLPFVLAALAPLLAAAAVVMLIRPAGVARVYSLCSDATEVAGKTHDY